MYPVLPEKWRVYSRRAQSLYIVLVLTLLCAVVKCLHFLQSCVCVCLEPITSLLIERLHILCVQPAVAGLQAITNVIEG